MLSGVDINDGSMFQRRHRLRPLMDLRPSISAWIGRTVTYSIRGTPEWLVSNQQHRRP